MICKVCNSHVDDNFEYCPVCGTKVEHQAQPDAGYGQYGAPQPQTDIGTVLRNTFSSNLFLAACILATVVPAVGIIIDVFSFNIFGTVISVIGAVAMWMLYSAASQGKGLADYTTPFKMIHVLTTIQWVCGWIAVGGLGFMALIIFVSEDIISDMALKIADNYAYGWNEVMSELGINFASRLLVSVFIIAAVIMVILNIFYFGNLRKCAASFKDTAVSGAPMLHKIGTIKAWMIVLGILNALTAVGSLGDSVLAFVSNGCSSALMILMFIILGNIKDQVQCD